MEPCRYHTSSGPHLALIVDGVCYDLTALDPACFGTMTAWLQWTAVVASPHELLFRLAAQSRPVGRRPEDEKLLKPINEQAVLLTGTDLVPPDDFSLADGNVITSQIPGIGRLRNLVVHKPAGTG